MKMFHQQETIDRLEHKLAYEQDRITELQNRISEVVDENFSLRLRIEELEAQKTAPGILDEINGAAEKIREQRQDGPNIYFGIPAR